MFLFTYPVESYYKEMNALKPSMVAQAYNYSYMEGRDWEGHGLSPAWAKKKCSRGPTSTNGWVQWCVPIILLCGKQSRLAYLQVRP
jgi:hypothetical protein